MGTFRSLIPLFDWSHNDIFTRLFKNAGILLTGNAGASILGLGSLALTGRALGPEKLGILALIQAYVAVVDGLFNFQSWQALIKYGAEALEHDEKKDFSALIKFGILLDAVSAFIAAAAALLGLYLVSLWRGWDSETVKMTMAYSIIIVFHLSGTPTAILRLFDRFKIFAYQQITISAFKLIAVIAAYLSGAGLWTFVLIWIITDIFGNLFLYLAGWWFLHSHGYRRIMSSSITGISDRFLGLWGFVWTTNLNSSIRMASRELDTLVVGCMAGAAAAGFYKVAKQFSSLLGRFADPLYQSIYPELARLWTSKRFFEFRQLIFFSGMIAGLFSLFIWFFFLFFGKTALLLTVGGEFVQSQPVLVWYMLAIVFAVFGFPLQPAMLSMGKPHLSFWVHTGSTILYFGLLPLFILSYGIVGAAITYVIYYLFWSFLMVFFEMRILSNVQKLQHIT